MHVALENQISTIYQLDGAMAKIIQNAPPFTPTKEYTFFWSARATPNDPTETVVSKDANRQVHQLEANNSLIIDRIYEWHGGR